MSVVLTLRLGIIYDNLYNNQNALQTPCPNTKFTRRLYSVHTARPQRVHGALEGPAASKRQAAAVFQHVQKKRRRIAFYAIAQRLHSVSTALLATAQRAPRRSATFLNAVERCEDAAPVRQGFKDDTRVTGVYGAWARARPKHKMVYRDQLKYNSGVYKRRKKAQLSHVVKSICTS